MRVIQSKDLVNLSKDTAAILYAVPANEDVQLQCEDGLVTTTTRHLYYTWCFLEYNRKYNMPVFVDQVATKEHSGSGGGTNKLKNAGLKITHEYFKGKYELRDISRCGMTIVENLINNGITQLEQYAITLDAEDYYQIIKDPEVNRIRERACNKVRMATTNAHKYEALTESYEKGNAYIRSEFDGKFKWNGLSHLVRSDSAKAMQFNHGVLHRGFITDINSDFFPEPTMSCFAEGMKDAYDYGNETRSGAKAGYYSADPMEETEYLHRLAQMIASAFTEVVIGDCGSTVTYPILIDKDILPFLTGKNYITEDKTIREIDPKNTSLIGQVVNVRFPAGCVHEHGTIACSTCCGKSSENIAVGANAGHTAITLVMGTGSQLVLSVKHSDTSSLSTFYSLDAVLKSRLSVNEEERTIYINKDQKLKIEFKTSCVNFISDILRAKSSTMIDLDDLSEIPEITLHDLNEEFGAPLAIETSYINKGMSLTRDVVRYLREDFTGRLERVTRGASSYYVIDMSEFDTSKPILQIPFKHFDMLDQHDQTKRFLHSPKDNGKKEKGTPRLTDYNTFGEAALAFLHLTKDKLKINLTTLEMAIYPFTVRDKSDDNLDYRMSRGSNILEFAPLTSLYEHRSLSAKMVMEGQAAVLLSPAALLNAKRVRLMYDVLYPNTIGG